MIIFAWKVGSKLPAGELYEDSPANKVNINDLFAGKKGILIGVPGDLSKLRILLNLNKNCIFCYLKGAFTPTCSNVIEKNLNVFWIFV